MAGLGATFKYDLKKIIALSTLRVQCTSFCLFWNVNVVIKVFIPLCHRQPFNFMTQEVLDATCLCLLAQAEETERMDCSEDEAERFIVEEFGRCLVQIIECSTKSEGTFSTS